MWKNSAEKIPVSTAVVILNMGWTNGRKQLRTSQPSFTVGRHLWINIHVNMNCCLRILTYNCIIYVFTSQTFFLLVSIIETHKLQWHYITPYKPTTKTPYIGAVFHILRLKDDCCCTLITQQEELESRRVTMKALVITFTSKEILQQLETKIILNCYQ